MKFIPFFFIFISCQPIKQNQKERVIKKPNIIVILADDLGYSDLSCMGNKFQRPTLMDWQKMGFYLLIFIMRPGAVLQGQAS